MRKLPFNFALLTVCASLLSVPASSLASENLERTQSQDTIALIQEMLLEEEQLNTTINMMVEQTVLSGGKNADLIEVSSMVKERIQDNDVIEKFMQPYTENFTHEEIKSLLHFFQSDVSKKFQNNAAKIGMSYMGTLNEVIEDVLAKFPGDEAVSSLKNNDHVTVLTEANFQNEVLESSIPVVVDAYASWCGPCKLLGPIFSELSNEMNSSVKFVKLNVDSDAALAQKLGVRAMPTILFFKNGEVVTKHVGFLDKESFIKKINENLL
jgi:thioredoxin 1